MEEEQGLTLGEIFKIIFKRVWWLVGVMAVCVLAVVLLIQFWYNKSRIYYPVSYQISYPDAATGKYPDETVFSIYESISLSTLNKIKSSDSEFESIDVVKMLEEDNISISMDEVQPEDGNLTRTYYLRVSAECFNSDKQAEKFIKAVAQYPLTKIGDIVSDSSRYGLLLEGYDEAESYEEKIETLAKQKEDILKRYELLTSVGGNAILSNVSRVNNIFTVKQQEALLNELNNNKYVLDPDKFLDEAEDSIKSKAAEIADLEIRIENQKKHTLPASAQTNTIKLYADSTTEQSESETGSTTIINNDSILGRLTDEQAKKIVAVNRELATISVMSNKTIPTTYEDYARDGLDFSTITISPEYSMGNAQFKAKLDAYKNQLVQATQTLRDKSISVYADNASIIYSQNRIRSTGGMNLILAGVIGAIAGFVIAAVVIYVIDAPKYKREKLLATKKESHEVTEEKEPQPDKKAEENSVEEGQDGE